MRAQSDLHKDHLDWQEKKLGDCIETKTTHAAGHADPAM